MNEEANVVNNSEEKKETVQLKSSEEKYLKLLTDTIASLQVEIEYYENIKLYFSVLSFKNLSFLKLIYY